MASNSLIVNERQASSRITSVMLVMLFFVFLHPYVYKGISINYSFCLYPLVLIIYREKLVKLPNVMINSAIIFSLIFIISIFYYIQMLDMADHRLASFIVFMTIFSYSIINIRPDMVTAFKRAVILICVYFSIIAIYEYLELRAMGPLHFDIKNKLGSQRYGFIYILAFWLVLLGYPDSVRNLILKYSLLVIITAGLFFTFSRSSIVAFVGTIFVYIILKVCREFIRQNYIELFRIVFIASIVISTIILIYYFFPITVEFYKYTLFDPILNATLIDALNNTGSSEGMRVVRIEESVEYIIFNPLTGTGYLGIWSFSESGAGSAHNQLLDTLIRVGIIGFICYIYLLYRLLKYLVKQDSPLFWGMVGVLIYGLFHETFKESQGAFILAFLFGMLSQYLRDRRASMTIQQHSNGYYARP